MSTTKKQAPQHAREHFSTNPGLAANFRGWTLAGDNFKAVTLAQSGGFRAERGDLITPIYDFYCTLTDRVERAQYLVRHRMAIEDAEKALALIARYKPEWLATTRASEIEAKQEAERQAAAKRQRDIEATHKALAAGDKQQAEAELRRRAELAVDHPRGFGR